MRRRSGVSTISDDEWSNVRDGEHEGNADRNDECAYNVLVVVADETSLLHQSSADSHRRGRLRLAYHVLQSFRRSQ